GRADGRRGMPRPRRSHLRARDRALERQRAAGGRQAMKVLLLAASLAACIGAAPARAQEPAGRILVMPFENLKRDGRIIWLGEASAVLLTDDLAALGASAISRAEREQAFERLQVPPAATLTDATVIRIGQLVGADRVVVGTLQLEGDAL